MNFYWQKFSLGTEGHSLVSDGFINKMRDYIAHCTMEETMKRIIYWLFESERMIQKYYTEVQFIMMHFCTTTEIRKRRQGITFFMKAPGYLFYLTKWNVCIHLCNWILKSKNCCGMRWIYNRQSDVEISLHIVIFSTLYGKKAPFYIRNGHFSSKIWLSEFAAVWEVKKTGASPPT